MAFNIIEMLKLGKTEYLNKMTSYDLKSVVSLVRETQFREQIVDICKDDFQNRPYWWLDIIYDMDKYFDFAINLSKKLNIEFTIEQYKNILYNTKSGEKYIYENFWDIYRQDEGIVKILIMFAIEKSNNKDFWLDFLLVSSDLHLRALVINIVIKDYPDLLSFYGKDLTLYFTNKIGNIGSQLSLFIEKMSSDDVSCIAYNLFAKGYKDLFMQVKEFLFHNYDSNCLAFKLYNSFQKEQHEEFEKDLERYFLTDTRMQFTIYRNYANKLKQSILKDFEHRLRILKLVDSDAVDKIEKAYFYDLGKKVEMYINKYLDLSDDKTVEKIGNGSTAYALRLGDFVLKLIDIKWSYEKVICPNLYLIIKNLEEDYIRDDKGIVRAGLEVQPYLRRSVKEVDSMYLDYFRQALKDLGYFLNDRLTSEKWGDNVRLLDNYLDADTEDFDSLPEWFKEVPIVLVDRDRVYPLDRIGIDPISRRRILRIKQLQESSY